MAIEGPTVMRVQETATFTAETEGLSSWVWTLPSGRYLVDQPTVTITASTPGAAQLLLRGRSADGTELLTVHRISVSE